jgi:hypothetical protein
MERTNQILEDMLRAWALKYGKSWDKGLSYVEFSHNNSYQASIKMAPFEALYGRQCGTPLFWSQLERVKYLVQKYVTEPPRGGVHCQDQLEQFLVKQEHNQQT